jgi:hypothetical protein
MTSIFYRCAFVGLLHIFKIIKPTFWLRNAFKFFSVRFSRWTVFGLHKRECAAFEVDCLKCDGANAETRFRLSAKRTSPFKSAGRQFSRLLAAEVCASAVVMLDTQCSEVVWRVLATQSIRQFPLHFPSRVSPCAITFQMDYTKLTFHEIRASES